MEGKNNSETMDGIKSLNSMDSQAEIIENFEQPRYKRIGCDYYKEILRKDRNGIYFTELRPWRKTEITQDHGKKFLESIPKYDGFAMHPDNLNHKPEIGTCFNLYQKFNHEPAPGEWPWTEQFLRHIFKEQYHLGLRYLQILFLHPDKSTVILALVSKERQTGKTTFANWMTAMFQGNSIIIGSSDFQSSFNSHYATKNVIIVEETLLEKNLSVEKLKAITTSKYLPVNEKFVSAYQVPFYGKVILTSNNETKFAKIDPEEIRFFVRKLDPLEKLNTGIEKDLIREIPHFLHSLTKLPPVDWRVSRSGFTAAELHNDSLSQVVEESRSSLAKELRDLITDHFLNADFHATEFLATPGDIKERWFPNNSRIERHYIRYVLKNEFNMQTKRLQKYSPFIEAAVDRKECTGTPFMFKKENFVTEKVKK